MHRRGAIAGYILGILTFLVGIGLLGYTFVIAIRMFSMDPHDLLQIKQGKQLDLNEVAATLLAVIIRVLLLLVMAAVGGLIANRGVHMYADSRHTARALRRMARMAAESPEVEA